MVQKSECNLMITSRDDWYESHVSAENTKKYIYFSFTLSPSAVLILQISSSCWISESLPQSSFVWCNNIVTNVYISVKLWWLYRSVMPGGICVCVWEHVCSLLHYLKHCLLPCLQQSYFFVKHVNTCNNLTIFIIVNWHTNRHKYSSMLQSALSTHTVHC